MAYPLDKRSGIAEATGDRNPYPMKPDLSEGLPAGGLAEMRKTAASNAMDDGGMDVEGQGGWGYRLYEDGRITITQAPAGSSAEGKTLTEGSAYEAIMEELKETLGLGAELGGGKMTPYGEFEGPDGLDMNAPLPGATPPPPDGTLANLPGTPPPSTTPAAGTPRLAAAGLEGAMAGESYGADPGATDAIFQGGVTTDDIAPPGSMNMVDDATIAPLPEPGQGVQTLQGPAPEPESPFMRMLRKYSGGRG